ncbi:MAG: DUF1501 domain-containing protein [Bryobacterales bacterium]|nr:DUF1501 domain-containing protein [Bryobacterales bacterium]
MAILSRRSFLASSAHLAAAGIGFGRFGLMNASAQGSGDYRALVCVFLFGGIDAHNLLAPKGNGYAEYASLRQNLAIAQDTLLPVTTKAGVEYGLHPNLAAIHPFYAAGRMSMLANVGVLFRPTTRDEYRNRAVPLPNNLFSHSDQQQQWQTGDFDHFRGTGWGGRTADQVAYMNAPSKFPTAVSLSGNPILLTGSDTKPATLQAGSTVTLTGGGGSTFRAQRDAALQELIKIDSGLTMIQQAGASLQDGIDIGKLIQSATAAAPPLTTTFPNTGLGRQLSDIAKLIGVRSSLGMRRQIFFASLGGFDTHANQLATHVTLLPQLAEAIAAFYQATEEMGVANSVTTFTESEFGRTMQPSAGGGTDHAWGSHHFIVGGAVKGGDLFGTYPNLALAGPDDANSRGSYIPTTSLDQYGATLASWFGVPPAGLDAIFPNLANFSKRDLGFLS